jgi:hypothetical protein
VITSLEKAGGTEILPMPTMTAFAIILWQETQIKKGAILLTQIMTAFAIIFPKAEMVVAMVKVVATVPGMVTGKETGIIKSNPGKVLKLPI